MFAGGARDVQDKGPEADGHEGDRCRVFVFEVGAANGARARLIVVDEFLGYSSIAQVVGPGNQELKRASRPILAIQE